MVGALNEDCSGELLPGDQLSGQSRDPPLAEEMPRKQVEINDTPLASPSYLDTDDDDCEDPRPSEMYGTFTWMIEDFYKNKNREMQSNSFDVGGCKWCILIHPQGCHVRDNMSLFLSVSNHDELLPGWSHLAQFTICTINKDPKKSKYSDTIHRFWKKEHDWGWKKFLELSRLHDGFVVDDGLTIKVQLQVIREKAGHLFHCLDAMYRRELARVYLSNVEQICRRYIDERRSKFIKLAENKMSFSAFWQGTDPNVRQKLTREKTKTILKALVKHFFIEKEVTSTLVMDSLRAGLKALECKSKIKEMADMTEADDGNTPTMVLLDQNQHMFILADDVILLLERTLLFGIIPHQPLTIRDAETSENCAMDGSLCDKDSIEHERNDRQLIELGCKILEFFALAEIFSRIEAAYQEALALERQEELIAKDEAQDLNKQLGDLQLQGRRRCG